MSALDFLSVVAAAEQRGFRPVARSAMERRQRDAGATFEERDGWLVPVSIPGEDERLAHVGIADLSHLTKLEVRTLYRTPGTTHNVLFASSSADLVTYRISNRRTLVLGSPAAVEQVRDSLDGPLVLDVTGALSVLALVGPEAGTLVRRLTHLHRFPSGGEVAHVIAHVLERDNGYWIVFPQEYGHYLWEVAVDRAEPLGGGPVGVDAIGGLP